MIHAPNQNIAITAPQLPDLETALVAYRTFTGEPVYQMPDLITFLLTPSVSRNKFLQSLNIEVTVSSHYAVQSFTANIQS